MAARRIALDTSEPGVTVIALEGEHDAYSSPALSEHIESVFKDGRSVVVDLRGATFVDSTVVSALIDGDKQATSAGRKLVVVLDSAAGPSVQHLYELTHLHELLETVPSTAEALEAAQAAPQG